MKNIAIIGSTGSIGVNALKVVEGHSDRFRVTALAAGRNYECLLEQARRFKPDLVCIAERAHAELLAKELSHTPTRVIYGAEGLVEASVYSATDLVIFSLVGASGLKPMIAAIRSCKDIGFANKEPFVIAGELIRSLAGKYGVKLLPIDSEHSAIFQCLEGRRKEEVRRIILTSSGGPFRKLGGDKFRQVTVHRALKHPRWKMGKKITIDSATLMNKGLEVIEASYLFDLPSDQIDVLVHPEAIVHSMVEFLDGSHMAQLAIADMRIPIQYAMSYPDRLSSNGLPRLDLSRLKKLTFESPDRAKFPCLELGYAARMAGGTMPVVLNAANEIAVDQFLNGKIQFIDIPDKIEHAMRSHSVILEPSFEQILEADEWARRACV